MTPVSLTAFLTDAAGAHVGLSFPVKMSVASSGSTENENEATVLIDRSATVTSMALYRDGMQLTTVSLNAPATVRRGDSISFSPGSMSLTVDGPMSAATLMALVGPYVIDEEPCLGD